MNKPRVLYIKGGTAIEDVKQLSSKIGDELNFGPDQYFLNVTNESNFSFFRLITISNKPNHFVQENIEAKEFALRMWGKSKLIKLSVLPWRYLYFLYSNIRWRPDYVLCGVEGNISFAALLIARISGAKFIFLGHNALNLPQTPKSTRFFNRQSVRNADKVIAHGPFIVDQAKSLGAQSNNILEFLTAVKPEGIPSKSPNTKHDIKTIIYVGRIEEDKGVFDLLNAFLELEQNNSKLEFFGSGSALTRLTSEATKSFKKKNIIIHGKVSHQEVFEKLRDAYVCVTPTQSTFPEGRCMTIVESLLVNTPVIAPNFGPFPYLVKHNKNGLLYKPDCVEDLTEQLSTILTDSQLYEQLEEGTKVASQELRRPYRNFKDTIKILFKKI